MFGRSRRAQVNTWSPSAGVRGVVDCEVIRP
jgi:hypothetical protein